MKLTHDEKHTVWCALNTAADTYAQCATACRQEGPAHRELAETFDKQERDVRALLDRFEP